MEHTLSIKAPAKINIFLDILGRLEDGYHSLFMLMQSISLCDVVTLRGREEGISLSCSDPALPTDERNIAYRAARLFFEDSGVGGGVEIHIEKNIPFMAGLGGGSADAAAVLMGLNKRHGGIIPQQELKKMALSLGADVPFCLLGGSAVAMNRGELLSQLSPLPKRFCVLYKPKAGVSTAAAYAAYDSLFVKRRPDMASLAAAASAGDWEGLYLHSANVLEQCVEIPGRAQVKALMRKNGARLVQMTGSGSAIFGIFEDKKSAAAAAAELKGNKDGASVFVCETL
ncbi:MAG: 4-(cytidine 5'-diphospho)-2-C-methyl-D-erythritol kinase [Clostridium sp.]|jgi:4-diphosphocytidyl-2-C-methyl-D-erythritol kinase|nr:4-(cytidine 5'-diphospho)-2-C-methyl-D-erythritol kinase [Clostridium sp.]